MVHALMDHPLVALPIFLVLLLVCIAFGRLALRLIGAKASSLLELNVLGMAVGFGCLAYLILAIGLLRALYAPVIAGLIVVMALVSAREIRGLVGDLLGGVRRHGGARIRGIDSLLTIAAVALGATGLICALAPPTSLDWDGMSYHLAIPKLYLLHHSIYYVFFTSHSNFPFLTEMLYTVGLALGGPGVAKLFHFSMYVGTAVMLLSLCSRHVDRATGKVAAIVFMSVPVALFEAGVAYADLGTALYVTAAFYAVLNWGRSEASRWLLVSAILGGFALSTKVLAGVPLVMLALMVLWYGRRGGAASAVRNVLLFGVLVVLVGCPWYVKAFVYTGNPFYPFLYNAFPHTRNWSQSAADAYRGSQVVFGMGRGAWQALMLPWNITFDGCKFYDNPTALSLWALIGPAFLALTPVYILTRRANRVVLSAGAVALITIVAWFVLMQHSRYLLGAIPLMCIVAGAGGVEAWRSWRVAKYGVAVTLGVTVITTFIVGALLAMTCVRAAIGAEPKDQYLTRTFDAYPAFTYVNQNTPKDAKVALFDEVRGFYLDREYMWANPGHHEMIPWARLKTGAQFMDFLVSAGYEYAIENGSMPHGEDLLHARLIPEAVGLGKMVEMYSANGVTVYRLYR